MNAAHNRAYRRPSEDSAPFANVQLSASKLSRYLPPAEAAPSAPPASPSVSKFESDDR